VKFTPSPPALVRVFDATVDRLRGVERRTMFGYPAVFVRGNMIAGLVRNRMVVRLSANDRAAFLALPGAKPFIAMRGRVMKQWAVVPPSMLKSRATLARWLARSLAHGRTLPPKVRGKGRATSAAPSRRPWAARRRRACPPARN
jgi:TfoX/Sxy family transcriptional regulator of competence genes